MTIGEKIKALRTERAMTQTELASGHITRNMLSLIESGNAQPSLATIQHIAKKLNIPEGYLLADEEGEYVYKKNISIARIRKALSNHEYSLCRELCEGIMNVSHDDELILVLSECSLGIAKEYFFDGKLKAACSEFDRACEYADNTVYNAERIKAEAGVYCSYMLDISPSLYSEYEVDGKKKPMAVSDPFCRYALVLESLGKGKLDIAKDYASGEDFLSRHVSAKLKMKKGEFAAAHTELLSILNSDESVSAAVMYDIFRELEQCCREINDFKGAYEYSGAKVVMLERLVAEE